MSSPWNVEVFFHLEVAAERVVSAECGGGSIGCFYKYGVRGGGRRWWWLEEEGESEEGTDGWPGWLVDWLWFGIGAVLSMV